MSSLKSSSDYVNACKVMESSPKDFLETYVSETVHWTVTEPSGKSTPIAGIKNGLKAFQQEALAPLMPFFEQPLQFKVVDVIVGEEEQDGIRKICLELEGTGTLKSTHEEWKNYYSWVMHFQQGKAVKVRAYLDSAAVNKAMEHKA